VSPELVALRQILILEFQKPLLLLTRQPSIFPSPQILPPLLQLLLQQQLSMFQLPPVPLQS